MSSERASQGKDGRKDERFARGKSASRASRGRICMPVLRVFWHLGRAWVKPLARETSDTANVGVAALSPDESYILPLLVPSSVEKKGEASPQGAWFAPTHPPPWVLFQVVWGTASHRRCPPVGGCRFWMHCNGTWRFSCFLIQPLPKLYGLGCA